MKYHEALEQLSQEHPILIGDLIATDDLEKWGEITQHFSKGDRVKIYNIAEPRWIERKLANGTLLLHPDVRVELVARNFKPLSVHKKMIWASVLVMLEGEDSKERYNSIKGKIIKKYSNKWWFDVQKRIKPTYAAKSRLERQILDGSISFFAKNSSFLGGIVQEQHDNALKMIPNE